MISTGPGRALAVLLACGVACGGRSGEAPPAPTGSAGSGAGSAAAPADAAAAAPDPQPAAPARELFAAIPADTPFLFATPDPIDAAVWRRFAAELDGPTLRARAAERMAITFDPIERIGVAVWGELGAALASGDAARALGIRATPRFAAYGLGVLPVARLELADPAAMERAIGRVVAAAGATSARRAPQTWIVDGGDEALLLAIAGGQLVVARGPRAAVHAQVARLTGAAAAPLEEATLRRLAKDHGSSTRGVGWVDPTQIAALARTPGVIPELDALPANCRPLVLELIASVPRIALGFAELSPARIAFTARVEVDAALAASLDAASRAAPSLPLQLAGRPLFAASVFAAPGPSGGAWRTRVERIASACAGEAGEPAAPPLPAPWDTLEAAALVLYGGTWKGFLPSSLDGFAGLHAPRPQAILAALGRAVPSLARNPPKDGGPFVPLDLGKQGPLAPDLGIARKGRLLLAASGPTGRARVADFAIRDAAPMLRLFVDVDRIRELLERAKPADDDDDDDKDDDRDFFTAADGDERSPYAGLVGRLDLIADLDGNTARLRLTIDLAPPPKPKPPAAAADPRLAVRDRCRAILRRSFAAAAPALARLGVTTGLDELARAYTTSLDAGRAVRSCAKLSDAERACLLAIADPIAAAPRCAPSAQGFRESELELPPLFSFFGPRPLEARFHPPIDGRDLRAKLVGTWVQQDSSSSETWKIDRAGTVTITRERAKRPAETKRYRLEVKAAGQIELVTESGGSHTRSLFMPGSDRFYQAGDATPIADEERFVAPLGSSFLIREPAGCAVVTREGALVAARCEVKTDAGARTLHVAYSPPCAKPQPADCAREESLRLFPGWIVDRRTLASDPYVRR